MNKTAVYAGTFDPMTLGHLDIVERTLGVFSHLIVAVVQNPKKNALLTAEERAKLVRESIKNLPKEEQAKIDVKIFSGLLVDFVREQKSSVVIRGLRAVTDYEYEAQMAIINRHLSPDIETVFLMTSDSCSFISSSVVREIYFNGGDVSGLVPEPVNKYLISRLSVSA
jgi:pantetheine-phosphate adenylyltransferase